MGHQLQVVLDAGAVGGLADGQLLERFLARREEVVFEAILQRHGPMVWGVCRRALRDHHDAEDAFQATFLVLARKAASVSPRDQLGPWLYGVACQTAARARSTRARQRFREGQVAASVAMTTPASTGGDDWLPVLDDEVRRLPAKYRVPVVLCELEGKTHREAADQLGWPIGTVSGRLSRARGILARRLGRSDLVNPLVPLAALGGARVVPASLVVALVRLVGSGSAGMVSVGAQALATGVIQTMLISKLKTMAAVLVGLFLVVGATGLAYHASAADGPSPPPAAPPAPVAPPRPVATPVPVAPAAPAVEPNPPADPTDAYPFRIEASDVYEFPSLQINYRDFKLKTDGPVQVLPMKTERGITGAMVLGAGEFEFIPEPGKTIKGHERAVMLRFNPEEQAAILPLDQVKKGSDQGAAELSRHLLAVTVRHCWHRGQEVMLPPKGSLAAVLYTREHGDLLISFGDQTKMAYNFTKRQALYEKK